jgi:hypothetical protein
MWPYTESENFWISRPQDIQTALVLEKMRLEMARGEQLASMLFKCMLMLAAILLAV